MDTTQTNPLTETLTDEMIQALRVEAGAAGDTELVSLIDAGDREAAAEAINSARAMDDSRPMVTVVAD